MIGSQTDYEDRQALQDELLRALERVNRKVGAVQALTPTIGDEFQGVYAQVSEAIVASLRLRLELAGVAKVRIGIGWGLITVQLPGQAPLAQDGPAWWTAREAVDLVAASERRRGRPRGIRVAFSVVNDMEARAIVNALLVAMDGLLSRMSHADQRLTLALLDGQTQLEVAGASGITQSAVAQRARRNGPYALQRIVELLGRLGTWPS